MGWKKTRYMTVGKCCGYVGEDQRMLRLWGDIQAWQETEMGAGAMEYERVVAFSVVGSILFPGVFDVDMSDDAHLGNAGHVPTPPTP